MIFQKKNLSSIEKFFFSSLILVCCVFLFWWIRDIIKPFVMGWFLAYLVQPLMKKSLFSWMPSYGMAFLITLCIYALVGLFLVVVAPIFYHLSVLIHEAFLMNFESHFHFFSQKYAQIYKNIEQVPHIQHWIHFLNQSAWDCLNLAKPFLNQIFMTPVNAIQMLYWILFLPFISFYFLCCWNKIYPVFLSWIPPVWHPKISSVLDSIDHNLSFYFSGQIKICLTLWLFYAVLLNFYAIPFWICLSFIAALSYILPYIGPIVVHLVLLIFAICTNHASHSLLSFFGCMTGMMLLESLVLTPYFIGQKIQLNPLWFFLAFSASYIVLGVGGMVFTMPLLIVFKSLIGFLKEQYHQTTFYLKGLHED